MFKNLFTAFHKLIFCFKVSANISSFIRLVVNTKRYRYTKKEGGSSVLPVAYQFRLGGQNKTVYLRTFSGDMDIFYEVFWKKAYRVPQNMNLNSSVIVDLGANTGMAALYYSVFFENPKVYAVEADEDNFQILEMNLSAKKEKGNFIPVHAAVFSEDKELFVERKGKSYNSVITEKVTDMRVRAMSMNTLMNLYGLDKIDLLKMDIEGSEEKLLSEKTEWLDKVQFIVAEIHRSEFRNTCEAILRNRGFVIVENTNLIPGLLWARRQC